MLLICVAPAAAVDDVVDAVVDVAVDTAVDDVVNATFAVAVDAVNCRSC